MPILSRRAAEPGDAGTFKVSFDAGKAPEAGRAIPATEAGRRGGLFETCANPCCRSGWLHLLRSRTAPVFEKGWNCSVACTLARVESAVRRLRPIVLTAAAAVLAMIPLSRSVFWGPMAVAIMGGLIVATVLTLLALPAMYAAWFRVSAQHR